MAEAGLIVSHLFREPSSAARALAAKSDLFSLRFTPEPHWLAEFPARRIFHWGFGPVLSDFKSTFIRQGLDRFLSESETRLFSFDLGPSARRHQSILPLSAPLGRDEIFRRTDSALKFIRRFYQGPLAAENYNYYPTGLYEHITEPDFIRSYLDEFDLGLTLDLAHAAVTAHNSGQSPEDYLQALPLGKIMEVHLSRPWLPPGQGLWAVDTHLPPRTREWSWLAALLKSPETPKNMPVFVEYYHDLSKLKEAQETLGAMLSAI